MTALMSPPSRDGDAELAREERAARGLLHALVDRVPTAHVVAAAAVLGEFTGERPPRPAVYLPCVAEPAARALVAEVFPELTYDMDGARGRHGGTVTHTWRCAQTGAWVRYAQAPDACTVVEENGLAQRRLWDELVILLGGYQMTAAGPGEAR